MRVPVFRGTLGGTILSQGVQMPARGPCLCQKPGMSSLPGKVADALVGLSAEQQAWARHSKALWRQAHALARALEAALLARRRQSEL